MGGLSKYKNASGCWHFVFRNWCGSILLEQLVWCEEAVEFGFCCFWTVGGVTDVDHGRFSEIAT